MRKSNIVLLADCIANLTGGAEKQIYELAKRLDKNKYNVTVISLDCLGTASGEWFTSVGCQYHAFRVVRIYGISGLIQGIRFYRFLKNEHIDILQTYHFSSDIWGSFWGRLANVPIIISNRRDMGFWRKPWHIFTYRCINRWVSKIVVVSNSIRDMVISTEKEPQDKIEVIYNGVDLPADLDRSLNIKDDDLLIMHVASLSIVKGHIFLFQAFQRILTEFRNVKLVLIGEDMMKGHLQNQVQQMGIQNNVQFLGERKDVPKLLATADICVLPSLSEGMSNAILEYMAAAKPVIATRVGGNPELVRDGFNGLLVEKENVQELTEALLKLIRDNEKRKVMGQNGFLMVKKDFTMEAMVGHYERLYKELDPTRVLNLVSSGGLFGAERVILNLAAQNNGIISWVGAVNNRHNPHLEIIKEAQNIGLKTFIFDSSCQGDIRTVFSVKKFIKENNINIIHTHNYKSNIIGFLATRFTRTKWVSTLHGWTSADAKLYWYEILDRFFLRFADKIICVSQNNYERLLNKGISKGTLAVISNGIDLNAFSFCGQVPNLRKDLGINAGDMVVAIVGRLSEEKGHKILFKALNSVTPQYPNIKCLVVGDGPLKTALQKIVDNLSLSDCVIFTGNRKDMAEVYRICDILVNASFTEGLPMTILEAMASKVAIIATRVGALPKVIRNGQNGILIDPGNPDALSEAMISLFNDAHKRQILADQAYKDVHEHYSGQRMAEEYRESYERVLK